MTTTFPITVTHAAQQKPHATSLRATSDRVSEGHKVECNIYPDFQGTCDCGYEQAIVNLLDATVRFEDWLDEATKNAAYKMETAKHDEDRHDRETMLRTLNLVRVQWDGAE